MHEWSEQTLIGTKHQIVLNILISGEIKWEFNWRNDQCIKMSTFSCCITFDMNLVGNVCRMKIQEYSSTVIFLCFMTKITSNIITHTKDIILTITNDWRQTESTDRRKHISGFFFSYNNTEKIHFSNNKHLFPLLSQRKHHGNVLLYQIKWLETCNMSTLNV